MTERLLILNLHEILDNNSIKPVWFHLKVTGFGKFGRTDDKIVFSPPFLGHPGMLTRADSESGKPRDFGYYFFDLPNQLTISDRSKDPQLLNYTTQESRQVTCDCLSRILGGIIQVTMGHLD